MNSAEMPHSSEQEIPEDVSREVDSDNLKAFAHPLRMQLLDALSHFGPQTASTLAERFGESSGSTSYHLRQLEKYGFVEEASDLGNKRERWWRRIKGSINFSPMNVENSPSARVAMKSLVWQLNEANQKLIRDFLIHGEQLHGKEWAFSSLLNQSNLELTLEQFVELNQELQDFSTKIVKRFRAEKSGPDARRIQVQINAFPLIDPLQLPAVEGSNSSERTTQ